MSNTIHDLTIEFDDRDEGNEIGGLNKSLLTRSKRIRCNYQGIENLFSSSNREIYYGIAGIVFYNASQKMRYKNAN